MSLSARNPAQQKGAGTLPFTPAGTENINSYDPEKDGDYTGMCMPYGLTRSFNGPFPIQIMQTANHVAFLFELGTWFHVAPFKGAHSAEPNPTWFGESIAKWDGDTLVVDTMGFNGWSRLDTRGHPNSDKLHIVQTFRHENSMPSACRAHICSRCDPHLRATIGGGLSDLHSKRGNNVGTETPSTG
jgi:hypothetical protein